MVCSYCRSWRTDRAKCTNLHEDIYNIVYTELSFPPQHPSIYFEGIEYSSRIGIPNSGMNFEIGFKDYGNNSYEDQWFLNLTFNLSKINPNIDLVSNEAFERISMKDKKYEKVRRENLIVKSKAFSVKAGGF